MTDDWPDAADNGRKCYDLAIEELRKELRACYPGARRRQGASPFSAKKRCDEVAPADIHGPIAPPAAPKR